MRSLDHLAFVVAASGLLLPACATPSEDESASAESPIIVDRDGADITVVKATALGTIGDNGASNPITAAPGCTSIDASYLDCTAAFEKQLGKPALHEIRIPKGQFSCRVLEVTTAVRTAAFPTSSGIGFHYAGYGGKGRFIPKEDLVQSGEATLKNGDAVLLHEFIGLANCWLGSGTSSQSATYHFKPYVQFEGGGDSYRNWDSSGDSVVTLQSPRIDRSSQVLQ